MSKFKMQKGLILIVSALLCLPCSQLFGSNDKVVRSFTINQGLSSSRVYSISQDAKGFIWLGTNYGLNRFDGVKFKTYHYDSQDPKSISSNNIRDTYIMSDGKMWIALDNGVDIYNPVTDSFSHFTNKTKDGVGISSHIYDITQDLDGEIWMSTATLGLFRYNPASNELMNYRNIPKDPKTIISDRASKLCADKAGRIWVTSYDQGVSVFDKSNGEFTRYGAAIIGDGSVYAICEDSYGHIWMGTFQKGLVKYDNTTGTFTRYPSDGNFLYHIQTISELKPGELLVGSDSGAAIFCMEQCRIANDLVHRSLLSNNNKFIYATFADSAGGIWLGSYFDGLEYYSNKDNVFSNYTTSDGVSGKVVNAVCEDKQGRVWIGTDDNGILCLDSQSNALKNYRDAKQVKSSYYCVHDIITKDKTLYVATYERGFEIVDIESGKTKQFTPNNSNINSARVFSLLNSSNGRIYIGTSLGLCYYNEGNEQIYRTDIKSHVVDLIEDNNGDIWVATALDGLWKYQPRSNTYQHYLSEQNNIHSLTRNRLSTLAKDNSNTIWIGTDGYGICSYDIQKNLFTRYEGLSIPNNSISTIIPEGNYLWIATGNGLVKWDKKSTNVKIYNFLSGVTNSQFTPTSGMKSSNGKIYFGTSNGFISFSGLDLIDEEHSPKITLTEFKISNSIITPNMPKSPLETSIENTSEITLQHHQSNIEFSFADLNFNLFDQRQYRYMLNGYDKQWHYINDDNYRISYTNVPSGSYALIIEATNNNGSWGDRNEILDIVIKPHFLFSKIAIGIYILLIVIGLIYLYKILVIRTKRNSAQQIREIQKKKEQEIYDAKIEFFTNVAHEIRTPLSLIIGPLEYIKKSRNITDQYGEYLSIIEQNYKRLLVLVNQLLDFRKVDAGKYTLTFSTNNISELIYDITSRFDMLLHQKKIALDVHINPSDLSMVVDREAMIKIISNLITNAIKHTEKNIEIIVSKHDGNVVFEIQDDGIGIPVEERAKIFNPFYQIKKNNKNLNKGVGIGLYMTQSLVHLMDGTIEILDREDDTPGARIKMTLAIVERETANVENFKFEEEYVIESEDSNDFGIIDESEIMREKTVLLVDDDSEILNFLGRILNKFYFTISANSAEEGLGILNKNDVDVIISDVMMDGINGFEFCKIVKSNLNTSHIPFVMLTAKTDTASRIEGLDYGADAYIEKPFSPEHIISQINNLLKQREELKMKYAGVPLSEIKFSVSSKLDADFAEKCKAIIEANIDDTEFTIYTLAKELNMSRTMVFQKIKVITGMTPNDFIKTVRLKKACLLMIEGEHRINEIGFLVGFSSSSYFAKCFSKQFGMLPSQFLQKLKNGELDG